MNFKISELNEIVANGGGIAVDATVITVQELRVLASYAGDSGFNATLRITNASKLDFKDVREIAAYGKGCVFFVS